MRVSARLNFLRVSPRKVRLVADVIRGLPVEEAQVRLEFLRKRSAAAMLKLLNSAVANATNNFKIEKESLYISEITVNEGPVYKRFMPRARGMAYPIRKKTSQINVILDELEEGKRKEIKEAKEKKQVQSIEPLEKTQKTSVARPEDSEKSEIAEKQIEKREKSLKKSGKQAPFAKKRSFKGRDLQRAGFFKRYGFSELGRKIFRRKSM